MEYFDQILQTYGRWTPALEASWVKASQRTPERKISHHASTKELVSAFLRQHPQAWTMNELSVLLRVTVHAVNWALYALIKDGDARREFPAMRGRRGSPQRYRWRDVACGVSERD